MKNLSVIAIIITVFSRGINGDWAEPCTILDDEPIIVCNEFNELTIMPRGNNTYIPKDFTAMEISYTRTVYLPDIKVGAVSVHPLDPADKRVTMNLKPELFDKVEATVLLVKDINCPATKNPFRSLKSVKSVHWINNVFKHLMDDIFAGFPVLEKLLWTDRKLEVISPTLFSKINEGLQELKVKGKIANIKSYSFARFKKLTYLQLRSPKLPLLRGDMFRGLESLEELDLSDCGIESIDAYTFRGLPLRHLDLSFNKISSIAPEVFLHLTSLKFLYLDHNKLQGLPAGVFRSNEDLIYLFLHNNRIKHIRAGTFQHFFELWRLDLSDNRIDYIEPGAFANSLVYDLILNNNALEELNDDTFRGLRLAQLLELNGNNITAIEPEAFKSIKVCSECAVSVKIKRIKKFPGVLPYNWNVYHDESRARRTEKKMEFM